MSGRASLTERQGVFEAELQAIARALIAVPSSWPVHIHSDSSSALDAITRFRSPISDRARLRTAGRHWLCLICRLLAMRDAHTSTDFSHIKAHSGDESMLAAGNRCADELAKRASAPPSARSPPSACAPLPLEQEEMWLSMREWDEEKEQAGRLVTADPRKYCMARMQAHALTLWGRSPTQRTFCDPNVDARGLYDCIRVRRPVIAHHVLRVLTDTAQWSRPRADAPSPAPSVIELQCSYCGVTNTALHFTCCTAPSIVSRRAQAAVAVCSIAAQDECRGTGFHRACEAWRQTGGSDVRSRVQHLRFASGTVDSLAVAAASFGAFNASTVLELLRGWGVAKAHRQELVDSLRCALFVWLSRAWFLAVANR